MLVKLLVFFLPTQLTLFFWPDWAFVAGIRIDYLAPSIYFTDLLITAFIISHFKSLFVYKKPLLLLCTFALINIFISKVWQISLFEWLKTFEFVLLGICLKTNWKELKAQIYTPLSLSIILIFLLSIGQILTRGSLGGIFYLIGERTFNINTPGIALANLGGQEYLRPYATLPHPNVLAGFSLLSLLFLWQERKRMFVKTAIILSVILIVLSYSQAVWLASIVVFLFALLKNNLQVRFYKIFLFGSVVASLLMPLVAWQAYQNKTIFPVYLQSRLSLAQVAGELIADNPLIGVGLGSFIPSSTKVVRAYPDLFAEVRFAYLQPVHNIFLLVFSEIGILGLFLLIWLLNIRTLLKPHMLPVLAVVVIGLVDHYFLTLQSGQLLFLFALLFSSESI